MEVAYNFDINSEKVFRVNLPVHKKTRAQYTNALELEKNNQKQASAAESSNHPLQSSPKIKINGALVEQNQTIFE